MLEKSRFRRILLKNLKYNRDRIKTIIAQYDHWGAILLPVAFCSRVCRAVMPYKLTELTAF